MITSIINEHNSDTHLLTEFGVTTDEFVSALVYIVFNPAVSRMVLSDPALNRIRNIFFQFRDIPSIPSEVEVDIVMSAYVLILAFQETV